MATRVPVRFTSVVDPTRYASNTATTSLTVAVRVRPLIKAEIVKGARRDIIRVMDNRLVLVLDPDEQKDYLDQVQNRTKEKRYTFDVAFGPNATNRDVYNGTVRQLLGGVLEGINTTVFAYGATGSGKTYTMVGSPQDPGLMVLCLERIFHDRDTLCRGEQFEVECSYLEVYNEVIYDLLVKNSSPLELREDPEQGVQVAGLKHIRVTSASEIMSLLDDGNKRRKTEATDANACSSRSHAVLQISVRRTPQNHYKVAQLRGRLILVDLAGSERAAETNNAGQKLRDGANINRSLLALANCINALGKANAGKAASYIPYRNSKLTRLLKDGLSGNSRTAMISTVSAAGDQYHHSINTLKYADRAKEIKTHVVQNVGTVESHVSDYQRIIDNLQTEVQELRGQLSEQQAALSAPGAAGGPGRRNAEDDLLSMIGSIIEEMNENIEERINLQKGLFEIEDANVYNRHELKQLDDFLGQGGAQPGASKGEVAEARERRSEVLQAIKDNERERERCKAELAANEAARKGIQGRVSDLVSSSSSNAFLNLLSTFRLQALSLQELKFQMAVREQIIGEQKEVIASLWKILDRSGMSKDRMLEVARCEGIMMDGLRLRDGRPPTVGEVPLSEALQAVKKEVGLPDGKMSPIPLERAMRQQQLAAAHHGHHGHHHGHGHAGAAGPPMLRYRRWPPNGVPAGLGLAPVKAASADASPYSSEDEDGGPRGPPSTRSDKSPLHSRAQQRRSEDMPPPSHVHAARPGPEEVAAAAAAILERRQAHARAAAAAQDGPTPAAAGILGLGLAPLRNAPPPQQQQQARGKPLTQLPAQAQPQQASAAGAAGDDGRIKAGRRAGMPNRSGHDGIMAGNGVQVPAGVVVRGSRQQLQAEGGGLRGDPGQLDVRQYGGAAAAALHAAIARRRTHTDADWRSDSPGPGLGAAGGAAGGGGGGIPLPPSMALPFHHHHQHALPRVRSDAGPVGRAVDERAGLSHIPAPPHLQASPPPHSYSPVGQAAALQPLNERLAKLKGKMSMARINAPPAQVAL